MSYSRIEPLGERQQAYLLKVHSYVKKVKESENKMASETVQELKKIERAFVKLRNNLRRADIDYTVQVSISSTDPQTVIYAAQMTAPANGLMPVRILAPSADTLIEKIKVATKHIDEKAVEIAYHKAQMEACDRTKAGHQERIDELEKEDVEEEVSETQTEETTQE